MDNSAYENLFQYLKYGQIPAGKDSKAYQLYALAFNLKDDKVVKSQRQVIPRYDMEKYLLIYHDDPTAAHFSAQAMYDKMSKRFIWTTMRKDIEDYCRTCDNCQRRGSPKRNNNLNPIQPTAIFERWGIDFMGPLLVTARGNKYIIVAIDYFTRWPEARPTKTATAQDAANFIYEEIICRFGPPYELQSDQGTHFRNEMLSALTEKFQIRHRFSSPYHPNPMG